MTGKGKKQELPRGHSPSVDWLNDVPDAFPVPLAVIRPADGSLMFGNRHLGELLGAPVEEAVGRDFRHFHADPHAFEEVLSSIVQSGISREMEISARRSDGTPLTVLASLSRVTYAGESECLLAAFSDVTALRLAEKMATLGTLTAGITHELNNPAAATHRASAHLEDAFTRLQDGYLRLAAMAITPAAGEALRILEEGARAHASRPADLDALARSDRETAVEEWLDEHGIPDQTDLAPSLAGQGLQAAALSRLAEVFRSEALPTVLHWTASAYLVYRLLYLIRQGSGRISEIVRALKSYSFPGQAQAQPVSLQEGLDNTLVILRSKLEGGVTVRRLYGENVPPVMAFTGELNQVWTNLLDNAIDAMHGEGELTIRTRREGGWAVVDIEDNGPGIPAAAQSRIFDPFFTTKEPGEGIGLGLSTSHGIVTEKHKGEISVESRPGLTRFTVRLPLGQPPSAPGDSA